jgi:hypothetical protein
MAELRRNIKYINKDFNNLRDRLIEYTKTYFPNTYNDFTPSSAGKVTTAATVDIDFFQQLPAKTVGGNIVPDFDYALTIPTNTSVTSTINNIEFLIQDEVDFSYSSSLDPTEITVYQLTGTNPEFYLLKKTRKAISATVNTTTFSFGSPQKFATRNISGVNIIGILDIFDEDGNQYYEVPNLAQESIFDSVKNTNPNDPNLYSDNTVPNLLKVKKVQRRFTSRFIDRTNLQLEFGAGTTADNDEEIVPNPNNVGLGLPFEQDKLTTAFSPTNFVFTDTYGIAPSNTTLTVRYLTGGGVAANVPSETLLNVDTSNISFSKTNLNGTLANTIVGSIASSNPIAADGGSDGDSVEEIRQNALGNFQNQLRTVTAQDYLIRILSLPPRFGNIAKAYAIPSQLDELNPGELPTVMDVYLLSKNIDGQFTESTDALKSNIRSYLSEYKMIGDSVRLRDAFIINIGVEFSIVVRPNYNNDQVLTECVSNIKSYFSRDNFEINEPILLTDINVLLSNVSGVQTVKNIQITNKTGIGYSGFGYDIDGATIDQVVYPSIDPMIFEVKFPNTDIKGRIVPI